MAEIKGPWANSADQYQAALSSEIHPLSVELGPLSEPFRSSVKTSTVGGVRITHTYANAPCTVHWARPGTSSKEEEFRLQFQAIGETHYTTREGNISCSPNTFFLFRSGSEIAAEQPSEACGIHIMIPKLLLETQIRNTGLECLAPVDANQGAAHVLRELVQQMLIQGESVSPVEETAYTASLMWLLGAVFAGLRDNKRPLNALDAQYRRISRSIERNFRDGAYSVREASSELGISPRYVQVVLRHFGTSFSAMLLERRLAESRDLLQSWPQCTNPVTEAAFGSGFNDLSHFSRSFSKKFGLSPKAYREKTLAEKDD